MTSCSSIQNNLLAYHLGALNPLAKLQVRRHLKTCPECAARLVAEVALDARLRRADLASTPIPTPARSPRPLRYALVLVPALALGGVFFLRPGTPGGPAPAFAEVEKALTQVKYITWNETQTVKFPEGRTEPPQLYRLWILTSPLCSVVESKSGKLPFRSLAFSDHVESKQTLQDKRVIYQWEKTNSVAKTIIENILNPTKIDNNKNKTTIYSENSSPWSSEISFLGNKPAIRYSRNVRIDSDSRKIQQIRHEDIWVEPGTRHLLKRRFKTTSSDHFEMETISDHFQYLDAVPAGTFDPPRPAIGERYQLQTPILSSPRKLLVEDTGVDAAIRRQARQIVAAMNAGDGEQLAGLFDHRLYADYGPDLWYGRTRTERAAWLRACLKEHGDKRVLQHWKIDPLPKHLTAQLAEWHKHEKDAPYPPITPMDVRLTLTGTADTPTGAKRRVASRLVFRLTPRGPRAIQFVPLAPR